jgi:FtsH-binding integral membrane protein
MQEERYVRGSSYPVDQLQVNFGNARLLLLGVGIGLLAMLVGLRILPEESTPLLVKVMGLLSASVACGAVGAYLGRNISGWLPIIGLFVLTVAGIFIIPGLGAGVLGTTLMLGWGGLVGATLGPLVNFAVDEEGPAIVMQAFTGTTAIMLITGFIALATGIDFSFLGPIFLLGVIGLLIVGLIGCFVKFARGFSLAYTALGIIIFSGGFLFKFFRLSQAQNTWDTALTHTMSLYLTFVNLFSYILQFLLLNKRR